MNLNGWRMVVWRMNNPSPTFENPDFECTITATFPKDGHSDLKVETPYKGIVNFQWCGGRRPWEYERPTELVYSGYLYARKKGKIADLITIEFKLLPPA
jgi:hypothetical protein